MVFKRREQRTFWRKVREAFYPKNGWRRAIEYIGHRIKRLPDTPHKIALGFGCGVFVSFTPFFGLHFLAAALLAMALRGNVLAGLLGTFFGNPVTFPFIAAASYRTGQLLFGQGPGQVEHYGIGRAIFTGMHGFWHSILSIVGLSKPAWGEVGQFFSVVFVPYLVGGLIPGIICAVSCYIVARPLVAAYQKTRRSRLLKRIEKRRAKQGGAVADPAE